MAVVNSCAQAFDRVGMPEGRYPLAQATLYLATAPKSNSIMGFFDALAAVEQEQQSDIPNHLKDGNRDKKGLGHGANYLYPHAYRDHWVEQQYLPSSLQGRVFYQPSDMGKEAEIKNQVARRREAQLAAQIEGMGASSIEMLTYGGTEPQVDRWLQRTVSQVGKQLGGIRDRLFALFQLQRHHLVLDLNAKTGLLTWEALRQVPEGGVYACVRSQTEAEVLNEQAAILPELLRPIVLTTRFDELPNLLTQQERGIRFDCIMGRNILRSETDKAGIVKNLIPFLNAEGVLVLAETVPRHTQRLYKLIQPAWLPSELLARLRTAEEAIYDDHSNPTINWDSFDLQQDLEKEGLTVKVEQERSQTSILITPTLLERWFGSTQKSEARLTYRRHLEKILTDEEVAVVRQVFTQYLCHQTVTLSSTIAYLRVFSPAINKKS